MATHSCRSDARGLRSKLRHHRLEHASGENGPGGPGSATREGRGGWGGGQPSQEASARSGRASRTSNRRPSQERSSFAKGNYIIYLVTDPRPSSPMVRPITMTCIIPLSRYLRKGGVKPVSQCRRGGASFRRALPLFVCSGHNNNNELPAFTGPRY